MNGSGHATLPAFTSPPPTSAQSFLIAAQEFYSAVEVLVAENSGKTARAWALLSAQTLEGLLKAYLSYTGMTEKQLRDKENFGHNLEKLWDESATKGLNIPAAPPQWCKTLNSEYHKPYYRYPMGLNGMSLPAPIPMMLELKEILDKVKVAIRP